MIVSDVGEKVAVSVTVTLTVPGLKPVAVAETCVDPMATPVTCGLAAGTCCPAGMKTLAVTVAIAVLLLVKSMVTPPAGAGAVRLTTRLVDCPGATVTDAGRLIKPSTVGVAV